MTAVYVQAAFDADRRATGLLPGETYAEGIIRLLAEAGEPVGAPDEEVTR